MFWNWRIPSYLQGFFDIGKEPYPNDFFQNRDIGAMAHEYIQLYDSVVALRKVYPEKLVPSIKNGAVKTNIFVLTASPNWSGNPKMANHLPACLDDLLCAGDASVHLSNETEVLGNLNNTACVVVVRTNGDCELTHDFLERLANGSTSLSLVIEMTPDWQVDSQNISQALSRILSLADYFLLPVPTHMNELIALPQIPNKRIFVSQCYPRRFSEFMGKTFHADTQLNHTREIVAGEIMVDWKAMAGSVTEGNNMGSIVIPVLDNPDITEVCIRSIVEKTRNETFEIVVIDNGSNDENAKKIQAICSKFNNVRLFRLRKNMMFAMGCNIGAMHSKGEYLIFLNNDIKIINHYWLTQLLNPLRNDKNVGLVGGKLLFPDKTVQHAGIVFSSKSFFPYHVFKGFSCDFIGVDESRNMAAVTGACMAIRKDDFGILRGFDPIYVNGSEDLDLCFKLRTLLDKNVFYNPLVEMIHYEGKSEGRGGTQRFKNRSLFITKWKSKVIPDDDTLYNKYGLEVVDYVTNEKGIDADIQSVKPIFQKENEFQIN